MIQLFRSNRKTISLTVDDDGSLIVRAPKRIKSEYIEKFIQDKQNWIKKRQFLMKDFIKKKKSYKFVDKEGILYLNKRMKPKQLNLNNYKEIKLWYKNQAVKLCQKKIDQFSQDFNLNYNKLKISDAKKRWGSCSSKNNINISWRVIMAPNKVVDYVIIHELAHIKHKNHSDKFWNLVEIMMKNYKKYDKWLEEHRFLLDF